MSAERTAEEWGRVAVSLPGAPSCWGDLEGVDGHDAPGAVCADGTWWRPDSADGMFLDVDHPATAGCLLALFGGAADVRVGSRDWVSPWNVEIAVLGVDGRHHTIRQPTLGRACIAAAEALGRWPGGER